MNKTSSTSGNWDMPPESLREKQEREFFETDLEYEKYMLDPKNEKKWPDINKDLSMGNLEDYEYQAVSNQEKTYRGLLGIRQQLGNGRIAKIFITDDLLDIYQRMPAHTNAASLSKRGFKQKLMRSYKKENVMTARDETQAIEYKKKTWSPFGKNKEEKNEQ